MPEFEEENVNTSPSENYTPSTDASKKPRTRRRSGGFKTDFANSGNANIGEISTNQALKEEKLSGNPGATQSHEQREADESQGDCEDRPLRKHKPRELHGEPDPSAPREPRTDVNPQPSPETLAAIASVEAKIAERRANRDARRAARDKNRPSKTKHNARKPKKTGVDNPTTKGKGLLASILNIFGLGPKAAPADKLGGHKKGRNGRHRGNGGNRRGQNRRRGGHSRRRNGQGDNRNNGRSNANLDS